MFAVSVLMCSTGQSMNRWSLEELVKRDPENFVILLHQIIIKTREVRRQRAKIIYKNNIVHCIVTLTTAPLSVHLSVSLPPKCVLMCESRFWSSVSMSWWFHSPSCSPLRCFRYICPHADDMNTLDLTLRLPQFAVFHMCATPKRAVSSSIQTVITFLWGNTVKKASSTIEKTTKKKTKHYNHCASWRIWQEPRCFCSVGLISIYIKSSGQP